MAVYTTRRLAADILGVGERRIRFDPEKIADVKNAMTRVDVEDLIKNKVITVLPKKGRKKKEKKRKRGEGSRKGKAKGSQKKSWMTRVRSQRELLRVLVEKKVLKKEDKRYVYMKIKGGSFRSKKAMVTYLKENELVPEDFELKKGGKK